jgi:AAA+ ATPase superfamily predicted ATPase
MFVDREKELTFLEEKWKEPKPQMIVPIPRKSFYCEELFD